LSGGAGTAMNWWWDEYIRPNGLYHHYAALSRFLKDTPWLDPNIRVKDFSTRLIRILVLRGKDWARIWAQNREYNWYRSQRLDAIRETEERELRIDGLRPGPYRVEWWDAWKGEVARVEQRTCKKDLVLSLPKLRTDLAVRVLAAPEGPAGGAD
jgi:hypothetical protein